MQLELQDSSVLMLHQRLIDGMACLLSVQRFKQSRQKVFVNQLLAKSNMVQSLHKVSTLA